jgi:hypothetical protein
VLSALSTDHKTAILAAAAILIMFALCSSFVFPSQAGGNCSPPAS